MAQKMIPQRNEISPDEQWDLRPLFASDSEWEESYISLEKNIAAYNDFKGRLAESLDTFRKALEFDISVSRNMEKLYVYAHLKSDEDKTNQKYLGMYQKAINLYTRIAELSSYLVPEIQRIDGETINSYKNDASMEKYSFFLYKILRQKPHTRSEEVEQILAMGTEVAAAASQFFSQIDNADIKFGSVVNDRGEAVELSHGNFSTLLQSKDPAIRKEVFRRYYSSYDYLKNGISSALASSIKKDCFYARVRNHKSAIEASLFADNVPLSVYTNLISAVSANKGPLFEYLGLRKKYLGLKELHFCDTYVPLVADIDFSMKYDEAVETCVSALAPLGSEYCSTLKKGLLEGWVDRYENRGKRSGAYSSGCYDSPPYILMNYEENNINSLYTLIHEAGHSMHSYFSKKKQDYINSEYTIFVAEVASTFNEALLSAFLLKKYSDNPEMRAYVLNREIDNIRATLYRQTMFAEFEQITHEYAEKNMPLTLETLTDAYRGLLEKYFGDSMLLDDELRLECLRIPHFYSAFYVYKYATGISAALCLAQKVANGGTAERESYLEFLGLGGTLYPIEQLSRAGIDMKSPQPVEGALEYFASLVREFKEILADLKHK